MEISAGEMVQWLSAQTALAEDLSDCPAPISGDSQQPVTPTPGDTAPLCDHLLSYAQTYVQTDTYTCLKTKYI